MSHELATFSYIPVVLYLLGADTVVSVLRSLVTFLSQTLDEPAKLVIMMKIVYEQRCSIWHK